MSLKLCTCQRQLMASKEQWGSASCCHRPLKIQSQMCAYSIVVQLCVISPPRKDSPEHSQGLVTRIPSLMSSVECLLSPLYQQQIKIQYCPS